MCACTKCILTYQHTVHRVHTVMFGMLQCVGVYGMCSTAVSCSGCAVCRYSDTVGGCPIVEVK